jgi:hypothetical protein
MSGTPIDARGAHWDAAYAIPCFVKSCGEAIKKINAKKSRPRSTSALLGTLMVPVPCETAAEVAIDFPLSIANSFDRTTERHIVPTNRSSVSVSRSVDCRKQHESTDCEEMDKLHIPSSGLRFFAAHI